MAMFGSWRRGIFMACVARGTERTIRCQESYFRRQMAFQVGSCFACCIGNISSQYSELTTRKKMKLQFITEDLRLIHYVNSGSKKCQYFESVSLQASRKWSRCATCFGVLIWWAAICFFVKCDPRFSKGDGGKLQRPENHLKISHPPWKKLLLYSLFDRGFPIVILRVVTTMSGLSER